MAKGKTPFAEQEIEGKIKSFNQLRQLSVTSEVKKAVSKVTYIIVTVPAKIDDKKKMDNSEAVNACKQIGAALHSGTLVIYGDVAGLGSLKRIIKETLENTSGLKGWTGFRFSLHSNTRLRRQITEPIANLELKLLQ